MHAALKPSAAIHGAIFLTAISAVDIALSPLGWPSYFLLPLLAYAAIVLSFTPLRATAPHLSIGRFAGWPFAAAVALSVAASAALALFHALAHPDVADLATGLPVAVFGNLFIAGLCFSVVNATLEELIFRGVLWEVAAAEWNVGVALVTTSILFAMGHLHGCPPGPIGVVLAGLFGFAVGLLRIWTGGLGLAVAVHICADATIFSLLDRSGAFS